jgi:hypothetical protein
MMRNTRSEAEDAQMQLRSAAAALRTEAEEREKVLADLLKEEAAARSELEGQLREVQATVGRCRLFA